MHVYNTKLYHTGNNDRSCECMTPLRSADTTVVASDVVV
jgi:hypothetical protein